MHPTIELFLLFAGGFVAGSYGSVVGGGSLASFPVLILLGLPVDIAIGTNRTQVAFMMASSVWAYFKKKMIDWKMAIPMALAAVPAGILGARIVSEGSENVINLIVAGALIFMAALLPKIKHIKPPAREPKNKIEIVNSRFVLLLLGAFLLGIYGGFYGAGFGTFVIFLYIFLSGQSFLHASANSAVVGLAMSCASSLYFISQDLVDFGFALPMMVGSVLGAQFGVSHAFKMEGKWIKRALLLMVAVSAVRLITRSF